MSVTEKRNGERRVGERERKKEREGVHTTVNKKGREKERGDRECVLAIVGASGMGNPMASQKGQ